MTVTPADATLGRSHERSSRDRRPVGVPAQILGETILVEGSRWRMELRPAEDERGLCRPLSLAFSIDRRGGRHYFRLGKFPAVELDFPPNPLPDENSRSEGAQARLAST